MICEDDFPEAQLVAGLCSNSEHRVCKSCVVQSFEATGKVPTCPDPACNYQVIPTFDLLSVFADRPDLHEDLRRSITIFHNVHLSPCPTTGAAGVVSVDGDFVKYHQKCPARFRCNTCLRPLPSNAQNTAPSILCGCRRQQLKMPESRNPFFRHIEDSAVGVPQAFGIARNFQITEDHMRRFFKFVIQQCRDTVPCVCPGCSSKLHKSAMCNEMTCPQCGIHVCNFCGRAEKCRALLDHFGVVGCPRFDFHAALTWRNHIVHMRCPCGPKCQNEKHDCTDPAHRCWRKLLRYNRRTNWIDGFIRSLDPPKQALARKILREEFTPPPGAFSELYVSSNVAADVPTTAVD